MGALKLTVLVAMLLGAIGCATEDATEDDSDECDAWDEDDGSCLVTAFETPQSCSHGEDCCSATCYTNGYCRETECESTYGTCQHRTVKAADACALPQ